MIQLGFYEWYAKSVSTDAKENLFRTVSSGTVVWCLQSTACVMTPAHFWSLTACVEDCAAQCDWKAAMATNMQKRFKNMVSGCMQTISYVFHSSEGLCQEMSCLKVYNSYADKPCSCCGSAWAAPEHRQPGLPWLRHTCIRSNTFSTYLQACARKCALAHAVVRVFGSLESPQLHADRFGRTCTSALSCIMCELQKICLASHDDSICDS